MISGEALEHAVHRALRGEVPRCVRAIVATKLSPQAVVLHVFHYGPASRLTDFEEVVESELDQCLPAGLSKAPPLTCEFLPAETFEALPGLIILHDNPWAAA